MKTPGEEEAVTDPPFYLKNSPSGSLVQSITWLGLPNQWVKCFR